MNKSKLRKSKRRAARRKRILREIREWVVSIAVALLAFILIRTFLFSLFRVDGQSMQPTLMDEERLFVTVYDGKFGSIERSDVVICSYPNRGADQFVKRVVGIPGDWVYRQTGVTHVVYGIETPNGLQVIDTELDSDYRLIPDYQQRDYEPYLLGPNEYFVVGDNRYASHDSRDWNTGYTDYAVGPITRDMIVGHVRQVVWPLDAFRTVK